MRDYDHRLRHYDEADEYQTSSRPTNSSINTLIALWARVGDRHLHRNFRLNSDTTAIVLLGLSLIYLAVREPLLVTIVLSAALFFYCLNRIIHSVPYLNRLIGVKIRFWHVAGAIMALAATLSLFEMPAQAVFLSGLEQFLTNIAQQSSTSGAEGVDPQAINLVFNAIRAVFLLLVGVAALFAYNQAQQGNDWRPIATQAGLAIGIILVIDVITFLFVGDGTGNTI